MTVLKKATVKSYDATSHKATIQIAGSLAVWLDGVPVATDIPAADVVAGRQCSVLFLDPSNQDDAVVITIQGALPSVPSGATVAASATVVSETAFGQAAAPGSASPYSRGDHTHGTPADPVPAHAGLASVHHTSFVQADADALYETINAVSDHEAEADPHTVYGALAQPETWAALQTFNAGIKFGAGQTIKDSGDNARYQPVIASPSNRFTGDVSISSGTLTLDNAPSSPYHFLLLARSQTLASGLNRLIQIAGSQTVAFDGTQLAFLDTVATVLNTGRVNTQAWGLMFRPVLVGGTFLEADSIRSEPIIAANPIMTTLRNFHALKGVAWAPGAGSGTVLGLDVEDLGHANFATAIAIRTATLTGSPNLFQMQLGNNPSYMQGPLRIGDTGTPTEDLEVVNDIGWESATGFLARFLHTNTAARDYTFPDKAGTVAMTSDLHNQNHASRHEPAGADAMTVDAAAATGSLRTLGAGAQQAAAGDHSHGGGGADVKGGRVNGISDDGTSVVTFNTAFTSTPNVTATQASTTKDHTIIVESISTTGFTIRVLKEHGGGGDTVDVEWVATDAGDP